MMRQITHIGPLMQRVDAYIIDDSSLLSIYVHDDYAHAYLDPLIVGDPTWGLFRDKCITPCNWAAPNSLFLWICFVIQRRWRLVC
jgi:hypothetical protein